MIDYTDKYLKLCNSIFLFQIYCQGEHGVTILSIIFVSDLEGARIGNCALSFVAAALFPPPRSEINCFNLSCCPLVSSK